MARKPDSRQATETLHEIESAFDRGARWVGENPVPVLAALGAVLVVAAGIGLFDYLADREAREASAAVAAVEQSYLDAMGVQPGSLEAVEPANPETARAIRSEHVERFLEVAEAHEGTVAAVAARMEAADLLEDLGEHERAREVWLEATRLAPAGTPLRGLALERYAASLERQGAFAEAAEAHAEAGGIEAFPGRWIAMANAARAWLEADREPEALALADRLQEEAPDDAVPPHVQARLRSLQAARDR